MGRVSSSTEITLQLVLSEANVNESTLTAVVVAVASAAVIVGCGVVGIPVLSGVVAFFCVCHAFSHFNGNFCCCV